jgi:hypothetical protein
MRQHLGPRPHPGPSQGRAPGVYAALVIGRSASAIARSWHAATAVVVGVTLLVQTVLVVGMGQAAMLDRLVRLAGYFTIQASLLALVSSALLAIRPTRDGPALRALRLDALIAASTTFLVYLVVLRPVTHLRGWGAVADIGLHYVSPLLVVGGWALFGPRRRIDLRVGLLAVIWPAVWYAWTLCYGAVSGFYPYPFVDVRIHGYGGVLLRAAMVTGLLIGGGLVAWILDRRFTADDTHGRSASRQQADEVVGSVS